MRLLIVAVGQRLPGWAQEAVDEYRKRLGRATPLELIEVGAEPRRGGRTPAQMMAAEARRIEAAIPAGAGRIVLDERGAAWTTRRLASALEGWLAEGRDQAFLIGGPDGLDPALKATATLALQLSAFTLPHAMARVLLVEQIYRARSILDNHPYHRE